MDSPKGAPEWPLGHAASVNPDNRVVAFHIADRNGLPAGSMVAEVDPSGQIEAIHDIQILPESRNGGLGSTIIKQIAANAPGAVRILEAKNENAQRFWSRNGAGYYDAYKNSSLDWSSAKTAGERGANLQSRETDTGATSPDAENRPVKFSEADAEGRDLRDFRREELKKEPTLSRIANMFGEHNLAEKAQSLREFVSLNSKYIPSLKNWHRAILARESASNELIQRGSEVMAAVNALGHKEATNLLQLMQDETFDGVFANKPVDKTADEKTRLAHMRLAARYEKLTPEAKAAYSQVREAMAQQWEHIHTAMHNLIVATVLRAR